MSDFTINIDSKLDLSNAETKIKDFIKTYSNDPIQIKVELDPKSINTTNFGKQIQSSFSSAGTNAGKAFTKNMESTINTKNITDLINRLNSKGISQNIVSGAEKSLNTLTKAGVQINKIREVFSNDKLVSLKIDGVDSLGNAVSVVDKLNTKTKEWTTTTSYSSNSIKNITKSFNQLDASTASNKTLTWLKNNSKAAKDYGDRLKELAELQRTATNADDLKKYTKQVNEIKTSAASQGKTGASFGAEFKRAATQIGQFASIYGGWQLVGNSIRESVSQLKEMDSILTEISKVSDMTDTQLTQLGKDAFDYASKYGKKVTDYLQGVTEMNRSGFYGQQGIDLANTSVLAQAAGDMTADVANSYLLATNAAYDFAGSAEKLNAVLDGQNMITNRNSVNMTDMAGATSKAASMAAQTGVQVNELSAIIGTAVSRTKQSGDVIGTALKTLFINLQDTSNKKIKSTFDALGISQTKFVNGSEQLKTPIELLKELSNAYNALPDGSVLKSDVLQYIGNKRQANVLAAVLGGIGNGEYDAMLQDYSEGMGSASAEAEKSANNWEGSLNRLSNSWTQFISNFANSGQITSGINLIDKLVQALNSLVEVMTPLGTIGTGAGIFAFLKNLDEPINHRVSA